MKCTRKECKDKNLEIQCPECDGEGCETCNNGRFEIDGCPQRFCSGVHQSITLFELYAKGMPPIAGGALDQSASFINAYRYFSAQERLVKDAE